MILSPKVRFVVPRRIMQFPLTSVLMTTGPAELKSFAIPASTLGKTLGMRPIGMLWR
jgi:hypothetical protein